MPAGWLVAAPLLASPTYEAGAHAVYYSCGRVYVEASDGLGAEAGPEDLALGWHRLVLLMAEHASTSRRTRVVRTHWHVRRACRLLCIAFVKSSSQLHSGSRVCMQASARAQLIITGRIVAIVFDQSTLI